MKKAIFFMLTLLTISSYAQETRVEQELTIQKPVVTFQNNTNIVNRSNWSMKTRKISLSELTRGILQADLQMIFAHGGVVEGEHKRQVGDVHFILSKVNLGSTAKMRVTISEIEGKLSTIDGISLRQFIVRVYFKTMQEKVNLAFPITVDAEGSIHSLN